VVGEGILSTIGHTPLIRLKRALHDIHFQLLAKLESFNPGGSIKDRAAFSIIKNALETGDIQSGATVIESSSGNMGIGLAQACAYFELRFICVVDPKTTDQNIHILEAFGAKVDVVTEPDPKTGEFLAARIQRVQTLLRSIPNRYWPNQYSNIHNARAHHQTMHEVVTALDWKVDYLFCSTSTCGTLRGCAEYIRARNLDTKIVAVDAVGSVIFGGTTKKTTHPRPRSGSTARIIPTRFGRAVCPSIGPRLCHRLPSAFTTRGNNGWWFIGRCFDGGRTRQR
jgi:cysteine synthase